MSASSGPEIILNLGTSAMRRASSTPCGRVLTLAWAAKKKLALLRRFAIWTTWLRHHSRFRNDFIPPLWSEDEKKKMPVALRSGRGYGRNPKHV